KRENLQWRNQKRDFSPATKFPRYKSYSEAVKSNPTQRGERRNFTQNPHEFNRERERYHRDEGETSKEGREQRKYSPKIQRKRLEKGQDLPHTSNQNPISPFFRRDPVKERLKQTQQTSIWESPGKRRRSVTQEGEPEEGEETRYREKR
ncbi:Hypothetical predicted protein, partial [Pelobates cultripes]